MNNKKKKNKKDQGQKKQESGKEKRDVSEIECFSCGIKGHYANACPHRLEKQKQDSESDDDDASERSGHVTWASAYTTYQVNAVSETRLTRSEVLIDNQANVSIIHPSLLRNIMPAERAVKINGVGGHQFTVKDTGFLDPFFQVYAREHTLTRPYYHLRK